jgi:hypothetical protein
MNKINVSQTQMRKIRSLLGEEEEENLFFDRFAPEPAAELGEGQGIGSTALQNLPYSAAERFREVEEAARDPAGLLKGLGNLAVGTGDVFAEKFGADPTERGQMARQAGQKFLSDFEAENFARDPLAPVSNVLGVLAPFSPLGKGAMGRAALSADLPGLALATGARAAKTGGRTLLAAGKKTGELGGKLAAQIPGYTTGMGGERVVAAAGAGFESPEVRKMAIEQMTREVSHKDIGESVAREVQKTVDELSKAEVAALDAAGDQLFNVLPIKQNLLGDIQNGGAGGVLRQWNITVFPVEKGGVTISDYGTFSGNLKTATRQVDFDFPPAILGGDDAKLAAFLKKFLEANDSMTARELHEWKQLLDQIRPAEPYSGKILGGIREPIREGLSDVKGYDASSQELHEFFNFVENVEEELGKKVRVKGRDRLRRSSLGRTLQRAFENRGEEILDVVEELDVTFPSLKLKSKLAAQGMSGIAPTGLVGKSQVAGVVGGVAGLAAGGGAMALGAGIPTAIAVGVMTLPFFSPTAVGRVAIELGASARVAKTVAKRIKEWKSRADFLKIPESTLRGLTVAQVINRITQEENRGNLQMGGGRRSVPVWDATQTPYSRNAQGQGASSDSTIEQPSFLGQFAPR